MFTEKQKPSDKKNMQPDKQIFNFHKITIKIKLSISHSLIKYIKFTLTFIDLIISQIFQNHYNFSNLIVLLLYLYKYSDGCIICAYHSVAVVFD